MPEVTTDIYLLNATKNPGKLVEDIAEISYVTQRFSDHKHPKLIKFASGREVPYDQFKLDVEPEIGKPLPGYSKDDVLVKSIIPASYEKVVKFLIAIGHHKPLECCHATFMLKNITRKAALHFLRYEYISTNMRSQKYMNQGSFEYLLPNPKDCPPGSRTAIEQAMDSSQHHYEVLRKLDLDPEWSRCPYPNNIAQTMTFHTNFRQFRHLFDCLCGDDYVSENQQIAMKMLLMLKDIAPEFFFDFDVEGSGKSAKRNGSKYARNKHVNWSLPKSQLKEFVPTIPEDDV